MTILVVHHAVRDFAAWKPAFDEHQPFRTAHGAIRHWLYRSPDDPDDLVVAIEFPSAEAALGSSLTLRSRMPWSAPASSESPASTCARRSRPSST